MTLENVPGEAKTLSEIGSMLFTRGVSGTRVLTGQERKTIEGFEFECERKTIRTLPLRITYMFIPRLGVAFQRDVLRALPDCGRRDRHDKSGHRRVHQKARKSSRVEEKEGLISTTSF